jgi:hypothetical protein
VGETYGFVRRDVRSWIGGFVGDPDGWAEGIDGGEGVCFFSAILGDGEWDEGCGDEMGRGRE